MVGEAPADARAGERGGEAAVVLPGIHHVTAIAGEPRRNVDFYTRLLGLRLVKRTVNFDGPTTYRLYYGDELGRPGTILTFFPWPGAPRGRQGTGQFASIALAVPEAALGSWLERLVANGVAHETPARRFGARIVGFRDPDGLALELVAAPGAAEPPRAGGVPAEPAIRGIHHLALWEDAAAPTEAFLTEALGFRLVGEEGKRRRFATEAGGPGAIVDLVRATGFWSSAVAVGTIHHVAWRAPDDAAQVAWGGRLAHAGVETRQIGPGSSGRCRRSIRPPRAGAEATRAGDPPAG